MTTNYPGAVDSFTNPAPGDALNSPSHAAQHADANDAIEAIETELGTNPSGSESTVAARLTAIEDGTRLGTNSVGAAQIADSAVDTAAIQSKAVTAAKIADDTITAAQIAANAVGASELADSAVDTNAIADSAVTSAKIADGTITSTDVAASTFAAFGTVGNLLTANQASPATTGAYTLESGTSESTAGVYTAATSDVVACYTTLSVTAGETYTVSVNLAPVGRSATALLSFKDAGGGSVGGFPQSASVPAGGSARVTLTAVAPATATTVRVYPVWSGTGAGGDTVTATRVGFWKGAGGQWAMPGTPIPGGSRIAVNNAVDLSGTGTPEGVITAAPGSTWLQTDSTVDVKGWIRWVKATGTGNTGWIAGPEADTGVRNLAAESLSNSWAVSGSLFKLSRVGRTVDIDATFTKASASSDTVYTLPAGFRPQQATVSRVCRTDTADDFVTVSITSAGVITIPRSSMTSNVVYANLSFVCPTTAPTSLPGS